LPTNDTQLLPVINGGDIFTFNEQKDSLQFLDIICKKQNYVLFRHFPFILEKCPSLKKRMTVCDCQNFQSNLFFVTSLVCRCFTLFGNYIFDDPSIMS